jgi:hypothetical protein
VKAKTEEWVHRLEFKLPKLKNAGRKESYFRNYNAIFFITLSHGATYSKLGVRCNI